MCQMIVKKPFTAYHDKWGYILILGSDKVCYPSASSVFLYASWKALYCYGELPFLN
jgi:hypothetical protein